MANVLMAAPNVICRSEYEDYNTTELLELMKGEGNKGIFYGVVVTSGDRPEVQEQ